MFISIPHEVNYLTKSDKNIPEPLLRASKKSFAPPQSFHFLFRSLREILLSNRLQLQYRNLFTRKYEIAWGSLVFYTNLKFWLHNLNVYTVHLSLHNYFKG